MSEAYSSADETLIPFLETNTPTERRDWKDKKGSETGGGDIRLVADAEEGIVDALHGRAHGRRRSNGCCCRGSSKSKEAMRASLAAQAQVMLSE